MLDEQVQQTNFNLPQFGQLFEHFAGDDMKAAWARFECD